MLRETVEAAHDADLAGFVLLVDEAHLVADQAKAEEYPLSSLLAAVSALQKAEIPIALVLTGLPPLKTHLLEGRTYSERMFRGEMIGPLEPTDALDAFTRPLADTLVRSYGGCGVGTSC